MRKNVGLMLGIFVIAGVVLMLGCTRPPKDIIDEDNYDVLVDSIPGTFSLKEGETALVTDFRGEKKATIRLNKVNIDSDAKKSVDATIYTYGAIIRSWYTYNRLTAFQDSEVISGGGHTTESTPGYTIFEDGGISLDVEGFGILHLDLTNVEDGSAEFDINVGFLL